MPGATADPTGALPDPPGDALPEMRTPPPGPASRRLAARAGRYEPPPVTGAVDGATPIAWARARGANVVDVDGNRYVDLTGGFGAAAVGHRNARVVAAVARAGERLLHGLGDAAPHPDRVELAGTLSAAGPIPGGRVYFTQSGAEAVDLALKTVHLATGRIGVVAFHGGYHGTGLGALRATGRPAFRTPFESALAPATLRVPYATCAHCPYGLAFPSCDLACLDAAVAEVDAWNANRRRPSIGAWIVEPVLGREGIVVPPAGWLTALGSRARERGILVVADEILTGGGRTGAMWASDPLAPDLVTVGKGITGGFPLAALVGRPEVMDAWETSGEARHTTTFLAHPAAVAATLAALDEIARQDLPGRARWVGERLGAGLARLADDHPVVVDVRGVGAMWGVELGRVHGSGRPSEIAGAVAAGMVRRGYLVLGGGPHGGVLVLTPPLTITESQVAGALEALEASLGALGAG